MNRHSHRRPRVNGFWKGQGWLFLLASLAVHAAIVLLLPVQTQTALSPRLDILLAIIQPAPLPEPAQIPEPRQSGVLDTPSLTRLEPPPLPSPQRPQLSATHEDASAAAGPSGSPTSAEPFKDLEPREAPRPGREEQEPSPQPLPEPEPMPMPPPSAAPEAEAQEILLEYARAVKTSVLRQKFYPGIAERLGHTGSVKVGFTIMADGALSGVSIKSSSGWEELDDAATEALRRAAPFEPIPVETSREQLSLSITLMYTLD